MMVMKFSICVLCSALLASFLVPIDASIASLSHVRKEEHLQGTATQAVLLQSSALASSTALMQAFMRGKGPSITQAVKTAQEKMALSEAMNRLQGKLPAEVSALVDTSGKKPAHCEFDEASLEKALRILNNMVLQSWKELDKEIIKCKEFEDRNRGTYDQTMTDLARLAEQISDLERQRSEANENINTKEFEFLQIKFELRKQTVIYMKIKWANTQEMTIRKNDLAVMTFVLELTKCPASGSSTTTVASGGANTSTAELMQTSKTVHRDARICHSEGGELSLRFDDPQLEARMESKMTPSARQALREVLGRVIDTSKQSLLETVRDETTTTTTTTTTMGMPTPPIPKAAVRERVSAGGFWKICKRDEKVNCGLLHDTMSLEWGKFKDSVDELQHEMDKNEAAFFVLRTDLNAQMDIIKIAKGRFMMLLAEVISNLNADQSEQQKKEQQRYELDVQYVKEMAKCKAVIMEITFTNICAVIKVRNEVMSCSTVITEIIDCDVTSWVPEDCSVMCDDNCPAIFEETDSDDKPYSTNFNPYKCGGWQTLNRDVIVKANQWGIGGPKCELIELKTTRKCNQNKCPVDCEMSMWSGWSKCTKDCEGGVRGRTRSILTKPLNGGDSCNTAQEEESCNTGSCDRDCTMEEWTEWGFCTMACTPTPQCESPNPPTGLQERTRKVLIPTRGEGECPKDNSAERFNERPCNTHCCNEDEICIAKQDLVIAIDGSGSLRESGFKIIRDFAAELIDRYKSKYFSADAVKIGVVLFGQGEVMEDGTISAAVNVHKLTDDLPAVKTAIKALTWQKGFTNMAQALELAENMFLANGRPKAQSAIMVITDGKPTLLFETNQKVVQLKDKHVKLFFAPVTEARGKEVDLMKHWASQPWQSHLVHVPGLMPLKADGEVFAQKFIATFCPEAMSPSATVAEEKVLGYFLLKEHAICGDVTVGTRLSSTERSVGDCAALVRAFNCGTEAERKSCPSFTYGEWYKNGYCYAEYWDIPKAKVADWMMNRENPDGGANPICTAGWIANSFYDTYVFEVA
jgi:hypothetical protein